MSRASSSRCCTPTPTPHTNGGSADLVREVLGDVAVSMSSDVLPEFREYERASTTALNAYVQPAVARYLASYRGREPLRASA